MFIRDPRISKEGQRPSGVSGGLKRAAGAPRRNPTQDFEQVQLGPHLHCALQTQAACAAGFWQPQVQDVPGHFAQLQTMDCFESFMVDLLFGSTTGCHRWMHFRLGSRFSTVVCDEPSARVPDRSRTSTELREECRTTCRVNSRSQPVACVDRSIVHPDPCRTECDG
jgi:hypothetical protein